MKNFLFSFMFIVAGMLLFSSCSIEESDNGLAERDVTQLPQGEYDDNISSHTNLKIEYSSLEELNEAFVNAGLEPVSLEELGVTEEEYNAAQAYLNDPSALEKRCSGFLAKELGDMNNNGVLSAADIAQAKLCNINITTCSNTYRFGNFGHFSTITQWRLDFDDDYTIADETVAVQVVLGLLPCL